jgi:hypothetical protein
MNLVGESRRAAEKSEFSLHIVNSGTIGEAGARSENPWLSIPAGVYRCIGWDICARQSSSTCFDITLKAMPIFACSKTFCTSSLK